MQQKNIEKKQPTINILPPKTKHLSIVDFRINKQPKRMINVSAIIPSSRQLLDRSNVIDQNTQLTSTSRLNNFLESELQPVSANPSQKQMTSEEDKFIRKTVRTRTHKTNKQTILIPTEIFKFLEYKLSGDSSQSQFNIPLLTHLTTASIHQLYQNSFKKKFNIRNIIYNIGQQVQFIYMIVSGQFKVSATIKNNHYTLTKGSFFGFEDLINSVTRRNQVVCVSSEGVLIQFKRQVFENCCLNHLKTFQLFKQILEERIVKTKKKIREVLSEETHFTNLQKMFEQMTINQQKKKMLRSNKIFKSIDKQYKMIYTLHKFDKKDQQKDMTPKPWFKNSDRKMKMRIKQMQTRVGISQDKGIKRIQTQHSSARRFLTQLNFNPNKLRLSEES